MTWDRSLWSKAMSGKGNKIKIQGDPDKVFLGHTETLNWNQTKPIKRGQIWNLDTGSGSSGPLTIMNIDTEEYYQSELKL